VSSLHRSCFPRRIERPGKKGGAAGERAEELVGVVVAGLAGGADASPAEAGAVEVQTAGSGRCWVAAARSGASWARSGASRAGSGASRIGRPCGSCCEGAEAVDRSGEANSSGAAAAGSVAASGSDGGYSEGSSMGAPFPTASASWLPPVAKGGGGLGRSGEEEEELGEGDEDEEGAAGAGVAGGGGGSGGGATSLP
jgi:hypothetical protein